MSMIGYHVSEQRGVPRTDSKIHVFWNVTVPTKAANLGPMLGSQALPITSQDKVVSDRGVTSLKKIKKKPLVQLARLVVP